MKLMDLVGQKFGKLTVLNKNEEKSKKIGYYDCICECGNNVTASRYYLVMGYIESCGCSLKNKSEEGRDC